MYYLTLPFVLGLILDDTKTKVLLGLHGAKRGKPYPNFFDLPGGKVKEDEFIEEALDREVFEETGYKVVDKDFFGFFHHTKELNTILPQCTNNRPSLGICFVVQAKEGLFKPTELKSMEFIKLSEVLNLNLTPWARFFIEKYRQDFGN